MVAARVSTQKPVAQGLASTKQAARSSTHPASCMFHLPSRSALAVMARLMAASPRSASMSSRPMAGSESPTSRR